VKKNEKMSGPLRGGDFVTHTVHGCRCCCMIRMRSRWCRNVDSKCLPAFRRRSRSRHNTWVTHTVAELRLIAGRCGKPTWQLS